MDLYYYNEAFGDLDGSSSHAYGLLNEFANHKQIQKVSTFPAQCQPLKRPVLPKGKAVRNVGFSSGEQITRYVKRVIQSRLRYLSLTDTLDALDGNGQSVQLARVSLFDSTPLIISKKNKMPLVAEWNTPFFYEVGELRKGSMLSLCKYWERNFLNKSDLIYTISNTLSKMLQHEYDLPPEKFLTIPNGFSADLYPQDEAGSRLIREKVRSKFGWIDKTVIVFIGSLKMWHGIECLMQISKYFSEKNNEIQFVIIGDGEARDTVGANSQRLANLEWLGYLPPSEMAECLIGSDLGIMPYLPNENFYFSPLKLYDMIGAALPSVGFAGGQIGEVYSTSPETGWGMRKGALADYIEIIEYLCRNKKEIALKKQQLFKSKSQHSWQNRSDRLIDALQDILM